MPKKLQMRMVELVRANDRNVQHEIRAALRGHLDRAREQGDGAADP